MAKFDEENQNKQLEDLRHQEEEDLVRILADAKYNLPYINLAGIMIENEALRFVDEKDARKMGVAPFKLFGKNVHIAILSPNQENIETLKEDIIRKGYKPTFYMASHESIEKVLERYQELSLATDSMKGGLNIAEDVLIKTGSEIKVVKDIEKIIVDATKKGDIHLVSRILEVILSGAIALDASDIHIETEKDRVRLRYRLDGLLQDVMYFDYRNYKFLNSRIKLLSGMKLTSTSTAQDGRFSIFIKGEEINVRTSTTPGAYGESIVMRILNPKSIRVELKDLGIDEKLIEILKKEIRKPHGFILVTGPTGSGKTTTLYSFLKEIYSTETKIITIEDPIEYHIEGVTQTQVDIKKDYTFLSGLRAALRQDPDIVMVGEVRDSETADVSINASLTGHMVFSTLHTNDAAGVIPRLIDLGVSPKILPSALTVSIAQRLVRKLCNYCKTEKALTLEESNEIRKIIEKAKGAGKNLSNYGIDFDQELKAWGSNGCEKCNFTGYKGRIGIFEVILTNEELEKLILTEPSERDIRRLADKQGLLDMREDGVIKILKGISSVEEVKSVIDFNID